MKAKQLRALALTVAEVDDMLESLNAARVLRDLSGRQRQQLEDVHGSLDLARRAAHGGTVHVPIATLSDVLRCATMTQRWLNQALHEFVAGDEDE